MSEFQIETAPAPQVEAPPQQAASPTGDLSSMMAQLAQNQMTQGQQFAQLVAALKPQEAPPVEKPFEFDVASLLTPEQLADRSLDIGFMNTITSGLANTLMSKHQSEMADLRAQIASSNAALTSLQSQKFEDKGGDILFTTKEGKDYMAQVDPTHGLTRSEMAQAIAKTGNTKAVESYLLASANAVKAAVEKSKQMTVPKLGGGNVSIANADAQRVQKLNDEAAVLRAKVAPISQERDRLMAINRELFALTNKATV